MRRIIVLLLSCACAHLHAQDTVTVSLLFVGDVMQHESQMKAAYDPALDKYVYAPGFHHVKSALAAADLTIGNLEFTLAGKPYSGYPQFSAPDELLVAIRDAGFDVLVTANNHAADRGRQGLERTIDLLDSLGIEHTGTFKDTLEWLNQHPLVISSKGVRISLLNYTYGTNGMPVYPPNLVNHIDTMRIRLDLQKAASQGTDASIVFFHWGEEYKSAPGAEQLRLAQHCFRHGAKVVIGSHPHVLQRMEWDRETDQVVAYSLGNFLSGQRVRYRNGGAMFHLDLKKITSGGTRTSVADAFYSLVWVNRARDARKTFELIPVSSYGVDTTLVHGAAQALMQEFVLDARSLLGKENKGISERSRARR